MKKLVSFKDFKDTVALVCNVLMADVIMGSGIAILIGGIKWLVSLLGGDDD